MALKMTLDADPPESRDRFMTLLHRWKAAQYPDTEEKISKNPLTNYSERDLPRFALGSGFTDVHLELHIDVLPSISSSWDVFLNTSPHPWAPSLNVILAEQFNSEERQFLEQILRPVVEAAQTPNVDRNAYLTARKPFA
jgi:arsenite methyltransferase